MINLSTSIKLPIKTFWYFVAKRILIISFISFLILIPSSEKHFFSIFIPLVIFIGTPFFIKDYIYYNFTNFFIENNKITINSGLINKKSNFIVFDKIQTIKIKAGLIARFFGLSKIEIWTSSPSQIIIKDQKTENEADGILFLKNEDARWLKSFILEKHQ